MLNKKTLTDALKQKAFGLGFAVCGVARADALESQRPFLQSWLQKGFHGQMQYMARNREKRIDPRLLVAGAKSIVVVAMNYYPEQHQPANTSYKVARYAYGADYHFIIRNRLAKLADHLTGLTENHTFRVFTDSAPVLERSWAEEAGIGKTGKNTCLIIPKKGSFFFLGEMITSADLDADQPFEKDLCGSCRKCMDACPTGAIVDRGVLDAGKCISYLTIELKKEIPAQFRNLTQPWVFGCDICQEVCPHNRHSSAHDIPELKPIAPISSWINKDWETLTKEEFVKSFKKAHSPLARISYEKLMDNIRCVTDATSDQA